MAPVAPESLRVGLFVLLSVVGVARVAALRSDGATRRRVAVWSLWTVAIVLLTVDAAVAVSERSRLLLLGLAGLAAVLSSVAFVAEYLA